MKFSTEVVFTNGLINVAATLASVNNTLTEAAAVEQAQLSVLEDAVDKALAAHPDVDTCSIDTLTFYALGQLNEVPASEIPSVTRSLKTLIRNRPEKFTMVRGKNGGVKILGRTPAAPAADATAA